MATTETQNLQKYTVTVEFKHREEGKTVCEYTNQRVEVSFEQDALPAAVAKLKGYGYNVLAARARFTIEGWHFDERGCSGVGSCEFCGDGLIEDDFKPEEYLGQHLAV